jgi:ribulose-5-phosphate 4-epimerase/fuculose-1-phosphate aldolase
MRWRFILLMPALHPLAWTAFSRPANMRVRRTPMTPTDDASTLEAALGDLVLANRILAREEVLDAFGHVSIRHPQRPDRFFISRARSPAVVERADLIEFHLDGAPADPPLAHPAYAERIIHGAIYQARPDIQAVCHHHAASVLPFCVTGMALLPVFHLGATMGHEAPFWDSRDEFGDTNMLVMTAEEGASLARALGPHWTLLMRRHGAVVAGRSLRECVFRSFHLKQNAELQLRAAALGAISPLSAGEISLASEMNLRPVIVARAWEYWCTRLESKGA